MRIRCSYQHFVERFNHVGARWHMAKILTVKRRGAYTERPLMAPVRPAFGRDASHVNLSDMSSVTVIPYKVIVPGASLARRHLGSPVDGAPVSDDARIMSSGGASADTSVAYPRDLRGIATVGANGRGSTPKIDDDKLCDR
jgi:hypothetical protein